MKRNVFISRLLSAMCSFVLFSCSGRNDKFDATGSFEADEVIVSSEASGIIREFTVQEGTMIKAGDLVGYIDSTQVYLRMRQLEAQANSAQNRKPDISAQLASIEEQLKTAEKERDRMDNLVKQDAATRKQFDDMNSQVEVLKKQIKAQSSNLNRSYQSISLEASAFEIQKEQIADQLSKYKIKNPITGTVLSKYAEKNEVTMPSKALYKIADLSTILLRAYITGNQLTQVKLNQPVTVTIGNSKDTYKDYSGVIEWINDKAEFTPKTIQTKDERANQVYAIKIRVKNDGYLKIGMYAEVKFSNE